MPNIWGHSRHDYSVELLQLIFPALVYHWASNRAYYAKKKYVNE